MLFNCYYNQLEHLSVLGRFPGQGVTNKAGVWHKDRWTVQLRHICKITSLVVYSESIMQVRLGV